MIKGQIEHACGKKMRALIPRRTHDIRKAECEIDSHFRCTTIEGDLVSHNTNRKAYTCPLPRFVFRGQTKCPATSELPSVCSINIPSTFDQFVKPFELPKR